MSLLMSTVDDLVASFEEFRKVVLQASMGLTRFGILMTPIKQPFNLERELHHARRRIHGRIDRKVRKELCSQKGKA